MIAAAPTLVMVPVRSGRATGRPPQAELARKRWNEAAIPAAALGHLMEEPVADTGATLVSTCLRCEGVLGIDPCESPGAFGSVLEGECREEIRL